MHCCGCSTVGIWSTVGIRDQKARFLLTAVATDVKICIITKRRTKEAVERTADTET